MRNGFLWCVITAVACSVAFVGSAFAGTWEQDGSRWKYQKDSGTYAANEWVEYEGVWYYIKNDGYMASSTIVNGHLIDESGALVSDTVTYESEDGSEQFPGEDEHTYVLNPDTMVFHLPSCSSAKSAMRGETVTCKRVDVIAQGYVMCRHCRP